MVVPGDPLEYGGVAAMVLAFYKLLDVAKTLFLAKRVENGQLTLPCQGDPMHHQRMVEVHANCEQIRSEIIKGQLACHWKDRDEVRDFMESLRAQTVASNATTQAITALTLELRRVRNGKDTI